MQLFKGWYRQALTKGKWHRMVIDKVPTTACGRLIAVASCDFDLGPTYTELCQQCCHKEYSYQTSDQIFAPVGATSVITKALAVHELRRLSKSRVYLIRILDCYGMQITAKWDSDTSISIYITHVTLISRDKPKIVTFHQLQEDLGRFKTAIDCLCKASDRLALEAKRNRGLRGRLTSMEGYEYFEELLYEKDKQS